MRTPTVLSALLICLSAVAQQGPIQPQSNRVTPVQPTPVAPVPAAQSSPVLTDPKAAPTTAPTVQAVPASKPNADAYKLAAGTHVAVSIKHAISTRSAREGDPVYAETSFPVVADGHIVIPVGTYVQGVVQRSERPGRLSGHGALVLHFNTLIFPSGYSLLLPGALDSVPGAESTRMKSDQEGTVENNGGKVTSKDAGTIITTAAGGAAIGGVVSQRAGGALTGGAVGLGVGLASVLLRRGPDVRIESGTLVDMVLERDITVEHSRVGSDNAQQIRVVH